MSNKLTPPAELPDEQDLRAVLAYNMRLFRVNKGWSQEELARQCGLDRTYVSAVERKRWNIALSNIEKMATALGVAAYQLLLPPQELLNLMTNPSDAQQRSSENDTLLKQISPSLRKTSETFSIIYHLKGIHYEKTFCIGCRSFHLVCLFQHLVRSER